MRYTILNVNVFLAYNFCEGNSSYANIYPRSATDTHWKPMQCKQKIPFCSDSMSTASVRRFLDARCVFVCSLILTWPMQNS